MKAEFFELSTPSAEGNFLALYSTTGLCGLEFPREGKRTGAAESEIKLSLEMRRWHDLTVEALKAALAGLEPSDLPPLDLSAGTEFQKEVWRALLKIGMGETMSYGEVARAIGKPKALRAVGGACGANPIPVFVPCHRVLAANNKLGGFSSGLQWKRRLLEIERRP